MVRVTRASENMLPTTMRNAALGIVLIDWEFDDR